MKRIWTALITTVMIGTLMMGRNYQPSPPVITQTKKICRGYTVIEANKGIDCNGDTVRLVKKHGFFEINN